MAASLVISASGCSILEKFTAREASKVLENALNTFYSDPVEGLAGEETFVVPELLEDSLSFALEGISGTSYEFGEAKVNKNRTTVKIPVTFSNVITVEDIPMGTVDEVADALEDCDREDVEITFVLKSSKGDWTITDFSELVDTFFDPYESLVYVDENGMPTSFYEPFFDECVIDAIWLDPMMGNPVEGNSISSADALVGYVYFDRPMYMTFEADLIKDGTVLQTIEVGTDGRTVAYCEFYGENYSSGSYEVELIFDGGVVASTGSISVR
ncbi:MAG: hypothetical protein IJ757_01145 [Clostridiales bacterium]|nr:hypothetical protein [Clostridiales bacterium]